MFSISDENETMILHCVYCGTKLIGTARPTKTNHKLDNTHLFTAWSHCHNCGTTHRTKVEHEIFRLPVHIDMFAEEL